MQVIYLSCKHSAVNTKKYWQDLSEEKRAELATACSTTSGYLYLVFYGHKIAGPKLATRIEAETENLGLPKVRKAVFRPDLWGKQKAAA